MNVKKIAVLVAALLAVSPLVAQSSTASQKEDEIIDLSRSVDHGLAEVLGDPSNLPDPCEAMPAFRTPHDGDSTNDGGWVLVDFCVPDFSVVGSAQVPDCHHNDDDSAIVGLPFAFNLYGAPFFDVFINTNGLLSFGPPVPTFATGNFPVSGFPMVAPFWSDVDTGDQFDFSGPADDLLGHVWQKQPAPNTFAVTWDNVGYYDERADKVNTFQVMISDGTNAAMGDGNNICFCYDDMQWTTGDNSSGAGGFLGVPATVGINRGSANTFFQVGRFNQPGAAYDGPFGAADGVDFLDGTSLCFNASGLNVPPIPLGFPLDDRVNVQCDETLEQTLQFLSPEPPQTTSVAIADPDGAEASGLVINNTPGNLARVDLTWTPDAADAGAHVLTFTATDSAGGETARDLAIIVECTPLLVTLESLTANVERNGVRLEWTTGSEIDNLGFRILRAGLRKGTNQRSDVQDVGQLAQVLTPEIIPAQGSPLSGAEYEYLDTSAQKPGVVVYYLEDIDVYGRVTRHGPLTVRVPRQIGSRKR